jgi:hypothetical protein
MTSTDSRRKVEVRVQRLILFFMTALALSGITAFPIEWQLSIAHQWIIKLGWNNPLTEWIEQVHTGVATTNLKFPFMAYGTDWLAFAHLVIAVAFIGPLRDPVRNIWVIQFGIIACVAIFPLAFIAGATRGIPIYWRLIDCSFGVVGGLLLVNCYRMIKRLEKLSSVLAVDLA